MLAATLEDWMRFRESDPRMPYFDREGRPVSYAELLARAPAGSAALSTPELLTQRFDTVQQAMAPVRQEIASAKLDALVGFREDQPSPFQEPKNTANLG